MYQLPNDVEVTSTPAVPTVCYYGVRRSLTKCAVPRMYHMSDELRRTDIMSDEVIS